MGKSLTGLYIYDHSQKEGNTNVILADSAQMYFIKNKRFLLMKLYNGNQYAIANTKSNLTEKKNYKHSDIAPFIRQKFDSTTLVFSLKSFEQLNIEARAFSNHRIMKNAFELIEMGEKTKAHVLENRMHSEAVVSNNYKFNSLRARVKRGRKLIDKYKYLDSLKILDDSVADYESLVKSYKNRWIENYLESDNTKDSVDIHVSQQMVLDSFGTKIQSVVHENIVTRRKNLAQRMEQYAQPLGWYEKASKEYSMHDSTFLSCLYDNILNYFERNNPQKKEALEKQKNKVKVLMQHFKRVAKSYEKNRQEIIRINIEFHKKMALAVACVAMFLIGGSP